MKRLLTVLMISAIGLVGCSSKASVKGDVLGSVGGLLYQNKKEIAVDVLSPHSAIKYIEADGKNKPITFTMHTGFDSCEHNPRGVAEIDQTVRSKNIKYFTLFNNSQIIEHKYLGKQSEDMICAFFESETVNMADAAAPYIADVIDVIEFSGDYTFATLDNLIYVTGFSDVVVTANQIVVPETLVVGYDNEEVLKTDGTTQIGDTIVGTFSDDTFDYYKYNNIYVKTVKGVDVSSYIQFPK